GDHPETGVGILSPNWLLQRGSHYRHEILLGLVLFQCTFEVRFLIWLMTDPPETCRGGCSNDRLPCEDLSSSAVSNFFTGWQCADCPGTEEVYSKVSKEQSL